MYFNLGRALFRLVKLETTRLFIFLNSTCNKIIHPAFADRLGDKQDVNMTGLSCGCLRCICDEYGMETSVGHNLPVAHNQ